MNVKVLFLFLIIFLISITSVSAGDDVLSTDENDDMLDITDKHIEHLESDEIDEMVVVHCIR